jgi:pimeloyl-ACP methyl ester carboxylesterase
MTGNNPKAWLRALPSWLLPTLLLLSLSASAASSSDRPAVSYKFATVDGIRIFYREAGDSKAPTIVLLHGFPSSSHMFRDLIPNLDGHFHVIAPDYPGMGYSDAPSAGQFDPNDENLTDLIQHFLSQLGETRIILYMQDLGGPIGMRLATRHPELIRGLVIQNTPISLAGWNPQRLKLLQAAQGPVTVEERSIAEKRVTLETDMLLYRQGARNPAALNPDAWAVDAYALNNPDSRRIMAAYLADARLSLPLYPQWQSYIRVHKPKVLVVWGRNDPVFSELGIADIRSAAPQAVVHVYETGHFALEEDGIDIAHQIVAAFGSQD